MITDNVYPVKCYTWLYQGRNLTVLAQGQYGAHDIVVVRESGFNGELTEGGLYVYSENSESLQCSSIQ